MTLAPTRLIAVVRSAMERDARQANSKLGQSAGNQHAQVKKKKSQVTVVYAKVHETQLHGPETRCQGRRYFSIFVPTGVVDLRSNMCIESGSLLGRTSIGVLHPASDKTQTSDLFSYFNSWRKWRVHCGYAQTWASKLSFMQAR